MQIPETHYARAGDLRLAYQKWGEGPPLMIVPALISNVEVAWEHEFYRRTLEHLGKHMTCVQFDKRGIGSSDRFAEAPTLEQRNEDLIAVMDAVGWKRAHFVGVSEGGAMGQLFAADFPDRVESVVLINTFAPPGYWHRIRGHLKEGDRAIEKTSAIYARWERMVETWSEDPSYMVEWMMPSQIGNESFIRWTGRFQRLAASPKDFQHQLDNVFGLDAGEAPERISTRTMVMHVAGDQVIHVAHGRLLADLIPGARYVEIDGSDHFCWCMPNWRDIADFTIEFTTGRTLRRASTRRFATVLFTDIVNSTRQSAVLGDSNWRAVLDSHDRLARGLIDGNGGRVIKSTGDGFVAVFDVPAQGVSCGIGLCDALAGIGVNIRAGIHAGEIEVHEDGDISGIGVNLAARVEQEAADGELWTSSTVRDLMLGGSNSFTDRGEHELKGIGGNWRLFAVR